MRLNILEDKGAFIPSLGRADAPFTLPPFFFGDAIPIELFMYRRSSQNSADFVAVDLSSYQVSLQLGKANERPTLGFWTLTTTAGTSRTIASRADKFAVQDALKWAFGENTVEGGEGSYIVTLRDAGVWETPTAQFQGATLSDVLVFELSPGTSTTPAQYRIEVLEVAPGRIPPDEWSAGDTTISNSLTGSGNLWTLTIDPKATSGFYKLAVNSTSTAFIDFNAGPFEISNALAGISYPCRVQRNSLGQFLILFDSPVTTFAVDPGNLTADPFVKGVMGLSSTGVRELLDGVKWAPVELLVKVSKDNQVITVASVSCMLKMPINQPAVINIDTPSNSGITVNVSEDGSYLLVIRDGNILGEIPLLV